MQPIISTYMISVCLLKTALELLGSHDLGHGLLRGAHLARWYAIVILSFKRRTAVASSHLVGQVYSLAQIEHTPPRWAGLCSVNVTCRRESVARIHAQSTGTDIPSAGFFGNIR